jgi:selenocysteine lyase/cysteine desulfurase
VDPADFLAAIRPDTRLIALIHASNVTGVLEPVAEVGQIAARHDIPFLVDAAQTLGDLPVNVNELHCDLLAAPGHKGLLGLLGTGILYVRRGTEARLASMRQGGTGSVSEVDRQPDTLPDKFEAGNLNVPGIVGMGQGIAWLSERGLLEVRRHVLEMTERLLAGFSAVDGISVHGPQAANQRVGVISISVAGLDPSEVAAALDSAWRIQVRSGLHCAPGMHRAIGTLASGGTVRFSLGPFTTCHDIDAALAATAEIASASISL